MELEELKGIGRVRLQALRAVGIDSLRDLLYRLPLRYEDRTRITPCSECSPGMNVLIRGTVIREPAISYHGIVRITTRVRDDSGEMSLAWYNQAWIRQQLHAGAEIMLYGRVGDKRGLRVMQNPKVVTETGIFPVYRPIKGIPGAVYARLVSEALEGAAHWADPIPSRVRAQYALRDFNTCIHWSHHPGSFEELQEARRRFAFERMLFYMTAVSGSAEKRAGFPVVIRPDVESAFWNALPFEPTGAQRRALAEIASDMRNHTAMSRMVQGDVGCGKTAIAFGAIALACSGGFQAAMMAPTDILAHQHYETARSVLEPLGINCMLRTGSMKASERHRVDEAIREGKCDAVFGTHALISESVSYRRLGLVITDEQHRFGVRQRSLLQEKGERGGRMPHVLVMSATPIPRSLALILYGDLDLSLVDELPPDRKPVRTRIVPENKRHDMYAFLREEVLRGQQAYVICPLVEDSDAMEEVRSAKSVFDELKSSELRDLRCGLLWGGQPAEEKNDTLSAFAAGKLDVLVSTTVVEVGVNVPNASVMVIENAERFGLAQLHQLRGRVGRSEKQGWCFLLADKCERLQIIAETNDGFVIAQKDLEQRGPGDLMGTRQSGTGVESIIDFDMRMLDEVVQCVRMIDNDPDYYKERVAIELEAKRRHGEAMLN